MDEQHTPTRADLVALWHQHGLDSRRDGGLAYNVDDYARIWRKMEGFDKNPAAMLSNLGHPEEFVSALGRYMAAN
jgi:hypothetical protein